MKKVVESRRPVGLLPESETLKSRRLARREIVKDLVCGMEKPKSEMKTKLEYKGKTYYFCTEGDKEMFEAFPENWIPKGKTPIR